MHVSLYLKIIVYAAMFLMVKRFLCCPKHFRSPCNQTTLTFGPDLSCYISWPL